MTSIQQARIRRNLPGMSEGWLPPVRSSRPPARGRLIDESARVPKPPVSASETGDVIRDMGERTGGALAETARDGSSAETSHHEDPSRQRAGKPPPPVAR